MSIFSMLRCSCIDWHKAAQALYSFGYVILLSTLLLAMLHLCCRFCCRRPFSLATVIGSLVVAGCTYLHYTCDVNCQVMRCRYWVNDDFFRFLPITSSDREQNQARARQHRQLWYSMVELPSGHIIDHFGDDLPSQSLDWCKNWVYKPTQTTSKSQHKTQTTLMQKVKHIQTKQNTTKAWFTPFGQETDRADFTAPEAQRYNKRPRP